MYKWEHSSIHVLNPKKDAEWNISKEDGSEAHEDEEVAGLFNEFFIEKIELLKKNIDPNLIEDPLVRLKEKTKDNPIMIIYQCTYKGTQEPVEIHT